MYFFFPSSTRQIEINHVVASLSNFSAKQNIELNFMMAMRVIIMTIHDFTFPAHILPFAWLYIQCTFFHN